MAAHAHTFAFAAVYFALWALFIGGLVTFARRANRREQADER